MGKYPYHLQCGKIVDEDFSCDGNCPNEPICYMSQRKEKYKVYVSLPITGRNLDDVRRQAAEVKASLETDNLEVITPFDMPDWKQDQTWEWYIVRCLRMMFGVKFIHLCDGWEQSAGCRLEAEYAHFHGIEVI